LSDLKTIESLILFFHSSLFDMNEKALLKNLRGEGGIKRIKKVLQQWYHTLLRSYGFSSY